MSKEICISSTPHETRLAILENDQLAEIYYERENEYTLAGSIYKGRVTRVLPECSRPSWTLDWNATHSFTSQISSKNRKIQRTLSALAGRHNSGRKKRAARLRSRKRSRGRRNRRKMLLKAHGAGRAVVDVVDGSTVRSSRRTRETGTTLSLRKR